MSPYVLLRVQDLQERSAPHRWLQGVFLRQEETPGADFLTGIMNTMVPSGTAKAVISAVLGSAEQGFLRWKIDRMFTQTMKLTQES